MCISAPTRNGKQTKQRGDAKKMKHGGSVVVKGNGGGRV